MTAFHKDACAKRLLYAITRAKQKGAGLIQNRYSTFSGMANLTEAIVSDEQLTIIAREFLTKWEELSPSLGLTQQQGESIRRTHSDYEDQKRESLRTWKRNKGNEATFGAFITTAEGISNMELADSVRGLMKTIPGCICQLPFCV